MGRKGIGFALEAAALVLGETTACLVVMKLWIACSGWVLSTLLFVAVLLSAVLLATTLHGLYLWRMRGQLPLDERAMADGGGKIIRTANGRNIEYLVWGSEHSDARILVVCHGQLAPGALNRFMYPTSVLLELNVKVICPSYPGHGYSDHQPFRRIANWPKDDVAPILAKEGIKGEFMVQGTSYGTAHAMAVASYFGPERCVAMGLCVPYLPRDLCKELGFHSDYDFLIQNDEHFHSALMAPVYSVIELLLPPLLGLVHWLPECKALVEREHGDTRAVEAFRKSTLHGCVRGVAPAHVFEFFNGNTTQIWHDPRKIETKCVGVWYAKDDKQVPPQHGKWLADYFSSLEGVQTTVRAADQGTGHFSYFTMQCSADALMTREMLELLSTEK